MRVILGPERLPVWPPRFEEPHLLARMGISVKKLRVHSGVGMLRCLP